MNSKFFLLAYCIQPRVHFISIKEILLLFFLLQRIVPPFAFFFVRLVCIDLIRINSCTHEIKFKWRQRTIFSMLCNRKETDYFIHVSITSRKKKWLFVHRWILPRKRERVYYRTKDLLIKQDQNRRWNHINIFFYLKCLITRILVNKWYAKRNTTNGFFCLFDLKLNNQEKEKFVFLTA
jgi:hypothetical protein